MTGIWTILSLLLLIPYISWGVYTLRLRYQFNEELQPHFEWITLAAVGLFSTLEILMIRASMGHNVIPFLFAVLGVMAATAALYGPMLVSVASNLAVDMIHPEHKPDDDQPDYGPAEALENVGDWEGALKEYTVIARIYPKEPEPVIHMANMLVELANPHEAARMFERALNLMSDMERAWRCANRLSGIYERDLHDTPAAKRVLEEYLTKYPDNTVTDTVQKRINRLEGIKAPAIRSTTGLLELPPTDPSE